MPNGDRSKLESSNVAIVALLVVLAILYFARVVLIPLALAVLLAFMLAPLVTRLRRLGLNRLISAGLVIALAFLLIGGIATMMTVQLADLARSFPSYQQNVEKKLNAIRTSPEGVVSRASRFAYRVIESFTPAPPPPVQVRPGEQRPVPVEIRHEPFSPMAIAQTVVGSLISIAVIFGVVIVFVIFILIQRDDLRDRVIRLVGPDNINLTTKVLDDAAMRVSRFLLAQFALNTGYGILAAVGLYFIGVPNPVLWGILALLLRYIPYLGIWIAAILPAGLAFAVEPGWSDVFLVFGLYFGIDLFLYNLAEPLLYGSSTGLSPLAVLVAAVFWTWLWGPVGLLLATPLTVCVVVLGRHVPHLGFLSVLLSDAPALSPASRFYQRMLARDLDDAAEILQEQIPSGSLEDLYDRVLIPALSLAEEDRHLGKLDEGRHDFLVQHTKLLVEDLGERFEEFTSPEGPSERLSARPSEDDRPKPSPSSGQLSVLCLPARDEADELGAMMLAQVLNRRNVPARVMPSGSLAGETVEVINRDQPLLACVVAVPPMGYMHTRYICRRLRKQFPNLKLLAAVLTQGEVSELKQRQPPIEVDELSTSLRQTLAQVACIIPPKDESPSADSSGQSTRVAAAAATDPATSSHDPH